MTASEFYIAVEFYLDGEYETTMYYTDFDSLVRNMDIMFHTDDFEDVQDVIDFLNGVHVSHGAIGKHIGKQHSFFRVKQLNAFTHE